MPAQNPLFQEVYQRISQVTAGAKVRKSSVKRLALLVTGIIAAQNVVVAKIADELLSLKLTKAAEKESLERTLERILSDTKLDPKTWYEPSVRTTIDWSQLLLGSQQVVLAVDESSKQDEVHLLRMGLPYWGHCLPLAWQIWAQNQPLDKAQGYWVRIDAVLKTAGALLPVGLKVIVLADRAYDVPRFVDRLNTLGWHWTVRYKANGSGWFRDRQRREWELKPLIRQRVAKPGMRWKARGWVFKDAGWRQASIVAYWQPGEQEPLVVISDLPPRWELLKLYGVRFWVEPGFRSDKKRGWQWEDSQIRKLAHHERLLLGMAWASLVTLCIGLAEARTRLARLQSRRVRVRAGRPVVGQSEHADQSLFTMGLRRSRDWLYQTTDRAIQWLLTDLGTVTWQSIWHNQQAHRYLLERYRPRTVLP